MHQYPTQRMQSHVDSIHSPQRTRNTIMNEWRKSRKFQRGTPSGKLMSVQCFPNTCIPMTAKMKTIMPSTKQRLPSALTVRPIIPIRRFKVGHDLANLKTRNYKRNKSRNNSGNFTLSYLELLCPIRYCFALYWQAVFFIVSCFGLQCFLCVLLTETFVHFCFITHRHFSTVTSQGIAKTKDKLAGQ